MAHSVLDLKDQKQTLETSITFSFERISTALRAMLWQECISANISPIQGQILIFCLNHPAPLCRIGYLAKEFSLTKPTISDAVKTLERKNLLVKKNNPEDQRSFDLILTEKGKEIARRALRFSNPLHELIVALPDTKKNQLKSVLARLVVQLKEEGILSTQRSCVSCQYAAQQKSKKGYYCTFHNLNMSVQEVRINCPDYLSESTGGGQ